MRLNYRARAVEDIAELFDYGLGEFGREAALQYADELRSKIDRLRDNPLLGPAGPRTSTLGYRVLRHRHHLILYRAHPDEIEILRVVNDRRNWVAEQID